MRRLNIVEKCAVRLERAAPARLHEITSGGVRVFLDPGTLQTFAAESEREGAPLSDGLEAAFPPPRPPRTGPSAICLSVTHACNLACRYCYVRQRHSTGMDRICRIGNGLRRAQSSRRHPVYPVHPCYMSRQTARRAIDLLRSPGPWRIGFFGGEPLLAWDLVREIVELAGERAQALGAKVRFSITTNGTLVTPDRAEFLARHGFSLIVSLDGPRELHDAERVTAGGGHLRQGYGAQLPSVALAEEGAGSFDAVIEGLQVAAAAGLGARTTLRSTFPLARPELVARLQFLNALADDGFARAVSVEPAWPAAKNEEGRMKSEDGLPPSSFFTLQPFREYLAAARWAVERIESGKRLRFHHLEKALERILLMRPAGTECGAGFGYLEIAPSGEIHACHKAVGGAIGHVETGVSERLRARWLDNRWYARAACTSCWARNVCGGGCRSEALEHAGLLYRTWPVACAVKKAQVRAALYVAAKCSRERLAAHLGPRARRPGRDRQETDIFHTAGRGRE